jgi:ComF family protein
MDALSCALLPAFCSLCGSPLPHLSSVPLCDACWSEIVPLRRVACHCCGDRLDLSPDSGYLNANLCRACRMAPPAFQRVVSYGAYQGRMRSAIHALKYSGIRPVAKRMGQMLAEAIAQLNGEAPEELLVVPVPLHRTKLRMRGFNQARTLAAYALQSLKQTHPGWKLELAPNALLRQRPTESQAGLTRRQRRINVRGAFQVTAPKAVAARHILIVDDIYTTGATVRAAAEVLLRAGAASAWVATLARAGRLSEHSEETERLAPGEKNPGLKSHAATAAIEEIVQNSLHDQPSF